MWGGRGEELLPFQQAPMDIYFSLAEKRLATSVAFAWVSYRFGLTILRLLRKYLNRAAVRRRQARRSSRVGQGSQTTETDNATSWLRYYLGFRWILMCTFRRDMRGEKMDNIRCILRETVVAEFHSCFLHLAPK
ncbi:uncharacterized protein BDCG_05758 [Blastomyces dermatitidis ER-3]|nr:uncharacterized protein BDCG_05758 [Blastomyces dermatitidis ER-3]EGE81449.2 hypothetical protein BDDG_04391 [Blastomyces dermatitidis ATCC 18188]EQL35605.1 hypothetical protein BDFG_02810 [Blastomyces dermatitidis ATCC 26199]OAT01653.1 hypothetical protein BDCG_05758 [Blastomyces dermatitidis ER-3]